LVKNVFVVFTSRICQVKLLNSKNSSNATKWKDLPKEIKESIGGNEEVYNNTLKKFSIDRELKYENAPARIILPKQKYYQELLQSLRTKLKVFHFFSETFPVLSLSLFR
jgi:hypothetical protein